VLAAFAASFGFAFSIFREVSPALMSARGLTAVAVFATLASGLGSALGIIREVPAATLAALAGNGSLFFSSIDAKPRFEVWDWSRSAIIKTSKLWSVRHRSNALYR